MKEMFTRLFWPILRFFETGEEAAHSKKSHRVILIIVGALFVVLSMGAVASGVFSGELGALIPVVVFLSVGVVAIVVGLLGSNAAVEKIWGRK